MRTFLDRMVFMRGLGLRLGWQKRGTSTPVDVSGAFSSGFSSGFS